MLVVVLDSATPAITAALVAVEAGGVCVLANRISIDARAHGELLAPAIRAVLDDGGATPTDLAAIVAGVGPGPFTGLRVGLVTAAAMADALGIPAYGVCTLDAIGHAVAGRVLVATDARRREVYWGVYDDGKPLSGPAVMKPADLDLPPDVRAAVGDGAHLYAAVLGLPVLDEPRYPPARALAELASDRILAGAAGEPLTPLYLRRPDAVEPAPRKTAT